MYGVWYLSSFVGNLAGGLTGSYIDAIAEEYGLANFFLIFTFLPVGAGLLIFLLNKSILKMMHGIR